MDVTITPKQDCQSSRSQRRLRWGGLAGLDSDPRDQEERGVGEAEFSSAPAESEDPGDKPAWEPRGRGMVQDLFSGIPELGLEGFWLTELRRGPRHREEESSGPRTSKYMVCSEAACGQGRPERGLRAGMEPSRQAT